jgi:hypothetical protein
MAEWFERNRGLRELYWEGVDEHQAILERLGDHHAAHLDLAGAHYYQQQYDLAEQHARRALELGFPAPGLAHNLLACIAAQREDWQAMQRELSEARSDPQHPVLAHNTEAARAWLQQGGPASGSPPKLEARHDFQLLERQVQPMLPGPLAADVDRWD